MARCTSVTLVFALFFLPLWCISFKFVPSPHSGRQQRVQASLKDAYIRPAVETDLDDITTVILDAFAPSQLYKYAFPQFDQFRQHHWNCMREATGREFKHIRKGSFLNVISVPTRDHSAESQGQLRHRVVAIAGWKIIKPHTASDEHGDVGLLSLYHSYAECSDNLDTNITRATDFNRQFSLAYKHFVDDYPHEQMYLAALATHPDWDGHGFGAMHCHWGMEKAIAMNIPVSLIATPAGWPLYDSLEFDSLANITIKTLDWPEDFWYEYMRYED